MSYQNAAQLERDLRKLYRAHKAGDLTVEAFREQVAAVIGEVSNDVVSLQDQADALCAATDGAYTQIEAKGADGLPKVFTGRPRPKPLEPLPAPRANRPIIGVSGPVERTYPQGFRPLPGSERTYPGGYQPPPGSGRTYPGGYRPSGG